MEQLRKLAAIKRELGLDPIEELTALAKQSDGIAPRADLTYSHVMRELRQKDPKGVEKFMKDFKDAFERALDNNLKNPEKHALMESLSHISIEV